MRLRLLTSATLLVVSATACATTGEIAQVSQREARSLADGPMTQSFVAPNDRLSSLRVWTATYGVEAPASVLRLDLRGAGETRTALVDGGALADNGPVTLVFPPVEDSAGERFTARFSVEGEPVGLYVNPHDPYADGRLRPGSGDLAFVTGHAGRVAGALETLGRIPGEVLDRLTRDLAFTVVWVLALAALATGAVRARGRSRAASRSGHGPAARS